MNLARISGLVYLVTFVAGTMALLSSTGRTVSNLVAATSYIVVTVLFFFLFKPVNRNLSLAAAVISLAGCVIGLLSGFRLTPVPINPLPFFGVYCLLIGWIIIKSTYLPRVLGWMMMFGGIGWLTFAWPELARALSPYNFGPGIFAEGALTLWLIAFGVNAARWKATVEQS